MDVTWHIVKWVWAAFFLAYLAVQVIALRRLKGDLKRRSNKVLAVMVISMGVSDAIRTIFFFENRVADRIGMLTVGAAAIVSTLFLIRMFGERPTDDRVGQDGAERYIQSLELN